MPDTPDIPAHHHRLKIFHRFALNIMTGRKSFEIRLNDRDFQVGDTISYEVVDNNGDPTTLFMVNYRITYVSGFGQKRGFVVMSILPDQMEDKADGAI